LNKKTDVPVLPSISGLGSPSSFLTIREAKLALDALGLFKGKLDSEDTVPFREAVMKFQADHHIQPDGVLGGATARALAPSVPEFRLPRFTEASADLVNSYRLLFEVNGP
jgi:hypothetical protein